jgi:peptide/nickel transport system ATP-binding protein
LLREVSFSIGRGESVGLLGPSGSGKSLLASVLVGLQTESVRIRAERLEWQGGGKQPISLVTLPPKTWRRIRGIGIALIPQDPQAALNPVQTCGTQLRRAFRSLTGSASGVDEAIEEVLRQVGLKGARTQVQASYPHQLSGGQLQRVVIAQALLGKPDLLIADEVTTALDAITTREILDLLNAVRRRSGMALLFITHRHDLLTYLTDRALKIEGGALRKDNTFSPVQVMAPTASPAEANRLLELTDVRIAYRENGMPAVHDFNLELRKGTRTALVGPSGCGKSTVAAFLVGLVPAQEGMVWFAGHSVTVQAWHLRPVAQTGVQLIFQDVDGSLNPRHTVRRALQEVLRGEHTVGELLRKVGLPPERFADRLPRQLSGGEKQRVAIARALATDPQLLVCDEAFSALDTPLRRRLQRLLTELSEREELSVLLITHDLSQVGTFASQVAVMDAGTIVEEGPPDRIFAKPRAELTRRLLRAADFGPSAGE